MKKNRIITIVTLIALMLVCFSACSPDDNTADAPYEPKILIESPLSDETNELRSTFKKAKDYGLGIALMAAKLPELENTTRKNPLNGQVLEYVYSQCKYTDRETKELGKHYSAYDFYNSKNEEIGVLRGTDLVCFYFNREAIDESQPWPKGTDAEAVAASFLTTMIGSKLFSEFECTSAKRDTSGLYYYVVRFARTTNGYETDEKLTVYLGSTGKVVAYNGYNLCKYDSLKKKFNAEKIERATNALTSQLATHETKLKDMKVSEPILITNANGDLYLQVRVTYEDDEGSTRKDNLFINVN